jgi:hypothetical protein
VFSLSHIGLPEGVAPPTRFSWTLYSGHHAVGVFDVDTDAGVVTWARNDGNRSRRITAIDYTGIYFEPFNLDGPDHVAANPTT